MDSEAERKAMADFFNYVNGPAVVKRTRKIKNVDKSSKAGNVDRSDDGFILDREQYKPNETATMDMLACA